MSKSEEKRLKAQKPAEASGECYCCKKWFHAIEMVEIEGRPVCPKCNCLERV